ncbi:putative Trm like protein [Trypanosoma vivax]|uniref:Multifunctional methyltransferase subunit TRM112 n=1 Tax=Trypanosoma vivax (strain Y486) TaxID=1055687 RepID=G0TYV9_TRYVY|nr:putative Trm like protein [Trypanosoma vivax]CCC49161.1 conserved hypothetical protein [Trypanosoma vivax Y486]
MRLLTHNFLCCLACQSFPLCVQADELEVLSLEFNADFVRVMLARMDYEFLTNAFEGLRGKLEEMGGTVKSLPEKLEQVDLSDDSEDLRAIHYAIQEVAVRQGALVCSQCKREYAIREFIPDMVLQST